MQYVQLAILMVLAALGTSPQTPAPCSGCDLSGKSFAGRKDLAGANFSNSILTGANFTGATLTGANFTGATLTKTVFTGKDTLLDKAIFDSSTLDGTDFTGATVGSSSFQFASMNCAKFINVDLTKATFGPRLKNPPPGACRTSFSQSTMNCEFIAQWKDLDLTDAKVYACWADLHGNDFSNAVMPGVALSNGDATKPTDLGGTKWQGANLTGAVFNSALLTNADFSGTSLTSPGATLTNADLTYVNAPNVKFNWAILAFNPSASPSQPGARLTFANLQGASFNNAQLAFADLSYTNLTGNTNTFKGAGIVGVRFAGANLSGIDFSAVAVQTSGASPAAYGVDFANANLGNTNLKNVDFGPNSFKSCGDIETVVASNFTGAYLCGSIVDSSVLNCANLTAAFIPSTAIPINGPSGPVQCAQAVLTNPKTNGVPAAGAGCFTTCPDGTPGPCTGNQWNAGAVPAAPCCVATPTTQCPPTKRSGSSCATNCDCTSKQCVGAVCQ